MNGKKLALALFLLLPLSACGFGPDIKEKPVLVNKPTLIVPNPAPVEQAPVTWHVITKSNLDEKLKLIEKAEGPGYVLFAVTTEGYQNLALNEAEMRRFVSQQNAVIFAYKTYYSPEEKEEQKQSFLKKLWQ